MKGWRRPYMPLGWQLVPLRIVDVFYDYGNERGYVMGSRANILPTSTMLHRPIWRSTSNRGTDLETVRSEIEHTAAHRDVLIFSNRDLRQRAIRIFDQTFAITYALEAISVLVAIVGIAGALMSIVFDCRREFGLLHYLVRRWSRFTALSWPKRV